MTNIIRIKKASFYAYHGVLTEEQNVGGKFEADVDMYTNFLIAADKDELSSTIDYHQVYKLINKAAHEKKYYLIEALAKRIADEILISYPTVEKVAVRVRKNNPPLGGVVDCVEVEIIKENK